MYCTDGLLAFVLCKICNRHKQVSILFSFSCHDDVAVASSLDCSANFNTKEKTFATQDNWKTVVRNNAPVIPIGDIAQALPDGKACTDKK